MKIKDVSSLNAKKDKILSEIEDLERALELIPPDSVLGYLGVSAAIKIKKKEVSKIENEIAELKGV